MPKFKRRKSLRKGKKKLHSNQKQRKWIIRTLVTKHKGLCQYCNKPIERADMTIDHIIPTSKGGLDIIENLALACNSCNQEKGNGISVDVFENQE